MAYIGDKKILFTPPIINGYDEGYNRGYSDGGFNGYLAGEQEEYDRFWNGYQGNNGTRRNYANAFRGWGWTDETYKPKYKVIATGSFEMAYRESRITKIENIDTSGVTNFNTAFYNMPNLLTIDKVDFSSATNTTNTFAHSIKLHTIGELVSSETTVWHTGVFQNCMAIKNLNITGTIAGTSVNFYLPTLTHDSLITILTALKNYAAVGDTSKHTCSISPTNIAKLEKTDEGTRALAEATQKGWTVS